MNETAKTIHEYAAEGDVDGLAALHEQGVDINVLERAA